MVRRKVIISRNNKVRGIKMSTHPELFEIAEQYRRDLQKRGIRPSQLKITQMIARKLKSKGETNAFK